MSGKSISPSPSVSFRSQILPFINVVLRLILGLVLIYAGWSKMFDPHTFMNDIGNYRILPNSLLPITAITLPAIEVVTGVCLILGLFMEGALTITTILILVFLAAIESAILRGLDIKCGCFGTTDAELVGIGVLVRDFLLLLCVIPLWFEKGRFLQLDALWVSEPPPEQDHQEKPE
jgi:uncharacterized membrane protein YphA (DoxX/SURF4 family)